MTERVLSLFPEVGHTQAFGGLVLPLVAHGGQHQHQNGHKIGKHFVQLLHRQVGARGNEQIQNVQSAEKNGAENAHIGTPDGEDYQGNGQPAPIAEGIVGPDAAGVVHDVVQAAQAGDHAAQTGGDELIPADVNARRVRGGRAFAHRPKLKTHPGLFQHIGRNQRQNNGGVGQEAVAQEQLAENPQLVRNGQAPAEIGGGGGKCDGGHLAAGELNEGAAEEVAEAHAKGGHGKTGHVLIGPEGNGEEAVQKSHEQ